MMLGKRGAPENAPRSIKEIFTRLGHHQQANSAIQRFLQGLVDELALPEDCVIDGGFKKPERILEKAAGHYDGKVGEVGDIRRFRILFDHPSTIQALRQMLGHVQSPTRFRTKFEDKGITVRNYDDYFWEPKAHGYSGFHINLDLDLKKGRQAKCEIQFMHRNMQLTDKVSHAIYEEKRKIEGQGGGGRSYVVQDGKKMVGDYSDAIRSLYLADRANYGLDVLLSPSLEVKKTYGSALKKTEPAGLNVV